MRNIVAVLLAFISVVASVTAAAQLPAVDPLGQYHLIGPAGRSDSRCIGRPETPLCAVETLLACFARRDTALCRAVWPPAATLDFAGASHIRYWWSYRVAAAEQFSPDEAVIAIAGRNCGLVSAEPDCRTTPAPPTRYRVQRRGNAWQVVEWASPPGNAQPNAK
ncbi:hypothetical protein [Ferrovibrio sp.]|uniref:hypothetical protein n=1 Tax=Ferrovibrio sp. TaxID=1917215 RepID=UPI00261D1A1B|nr:hypothetical protein [Ferrovibrio sp.]